jgi:hypothetical protein
MALTQPFTPHLTPRRLSGVLATLEARHRQPLDGQGPAVEGLERWLEAEIERRAPHPRALRGRRAALTTTPTLEGCAWSFNPTINRPQVRPLASGDNLRQTRQVLIGGPTGGGTSP